MSGNATNNRSRFLELCGAAGVSLRPLDSFCMREMTAGFFENLARAFSRRLQRDVSIHSCGPTSEAERSTKLTFRYFNERISIAVPLEAVTEIESAAGSGSFEKVLQSILDEESIFARNRVTLVPSEELIGIRIRCELKIDGKAFHVVSVIHDSFLERLRNHGKLLSHSTLRRMRFETIWSLRANRELDSFEMLVQLSRGKRIELRELLRASCELYQPDGPVIVIQPSQLHFIETGEPI